MAYGNRYRKKRTFKGKRRKAFTKRTKLARRAAYRANRRQIFKPNIGLGRSCIRRLRYVETIQIDPTAGNIASYIYRLNSLHDPNKTATGHQAYGYDQLMQHFDHYCVLGAKISVEHTPNAVLNKVPAYFGVLVSDDGTRASTAANINTLLEMDGTGPVKCVGDYHSSSSGSSVARITRKVSMKKFFGRKPNQGDKYQGSVGKNPDEMCFAEIFCTSIYGNDPSSYQFKVTIDYIALFTEPKPIAGS